MQYFKPIQKKPWSGLSRQSPSVETGTIRSAGYFTRVLPPDPAQPAAPSPEIQDGGASSPIGRPLHTQEQSAAADQKETVLREKEDAFYFSEKQVKVREAGSLYFYSMFLFLPPSLNSCA